MVSAEQGPEDQQQGHHQPGRDVDVVGPSTTLRPGGVHSHAVSIVPVVPGSTERPPLSRTVVVSIAIGLLAGACAGGSPEVPAGPDGRRDPVLVLGRDVYSDRCSNCHANDGDGGRGPKISGGATLEEFPEVEDQVELLREGKGAMPGFGDVLDDAELEAVARYVREVL